MVITNIHEAKTHLSRLLARVAEGSEIIIGKAGKPVAKLVPYRPAAQPRRKPGCWKGKVRMARDFDRLPAELAAAFRGERH
jgi:prevent-host-death family protein